MTRIDADPLGWLSAAAAAREAAGLRRRLRPRAAENADRVIDLAGNDYLGLARHPAVTAAAADAAHRWGAGSTGSRLVTGSTALHAELDRALAGFGAAEAALVLSSGYLANLAAVTVLAGPGSLVVSDADNHASIIDGCRLSRARVAVAPHRDVAAVDTLLAARAEQRALVVTDAIFSVDGDPAPLAGLHRAVRRHGAVLLVDEAHAFGVVGPGGRGACVATGIADQPDVVRTVTLSKALGGQGGAVLGPERVVDAMVDNGRAFIFDTGLAPPSAGAALAALGLIEAEPALAERVRTVAGAIAAAVRRAGLAASEPAAAIVGVPMPSPLAAVAAAETCLRSGVRVGCFRPPSVPDGGSRLRITARADVTPVELERLAAALTAVAATLP